MEFSKSQISFTQPNANTQIVFDLQECNELYQKDNSIKLQKQVEKVKREINELKQREDEYYTNLNLGKEFQNQIFQLNLPAQYKDQQVEQIIGGDPIEGNLIMTKQEFQKRYNLDPDLI